jgi:hypothetical protein
MATHPDKEDQQPLQPGITQPQPTRFPDPAPAREPPEPSPDPLTPPQ